MYSALRTASLYSGLRSRRRVPSTSMSSVSTSFASKNSSPSTTSGSSSRSWNFRIPFSCSRHCFKLSRVRLSTVVMFGLRSTGVLMVQVQDAFAFASAAFLDTRLLPSCNFLSRYLLMAFDVKERSGSACLACCETKALIFTAKSPAVPFPSVFAKHSSRITLRRSWALPVVCTTCPLLVSDAS